MRGQGLAAQCCELIDPSNSKKFRSLHLLLGILTLTLAFSDANAHGPSPAVLGAISDGESNSHLRLTVGLAANEGDNWRWVCPTAWGGPETPVVAHSGDALIVFAESGMVEIRDGVGLIVEGGESLTSATVRAVAASNGTVFVLARLDGDDVLMAFDGDAPRTIARLQGDWQSLALVDGGPVLGTMRDQTLVLAFVRPDGAGVSETEVPLDDVVGATAGVRAAGGRLWVLVSEPDDYRLLAIRGDEALPLFASPAPIHGPVPMAESLFAVSDGALWQLSGPSPDVWDDSLHYTCASSTAPASFVCAQTALYELFEGGVAAIPSFEHSDLLPPRDATGACLGEWLDYAGHAGIDIAPPEPEPEPDTGDEATSRGGCASAPPRSTAPWFAPFFAILLARCRR